MIEQENAPRPRRGRRIYYRRVETEYRYLAKLAILVAAVSWMICMLGDR